MVAEQIQVSRIDSVKLSNYLFLPFIKIRNHLGIKSTLALEKKNKERKKGRKKERKMKKWELGGLDSSLGYQK